MNINICFVGDIMPGGVLHGKSSQVSSEVKEYLSTFDYRLATLECAIGDEPDFDPVKMSLKQDVIYAPNIDLNKLVELNVNCVSLANNHAFDLGKKGLENTINRLDMLGIAHCGAGLNKEEASRPVIAEINGKRIGVLAFCDFRDETVGYVPIASQNTAGMNSLKSDDYIRQIKELKDEADYIYIILHWGKEHTFWPSEEMIRVADNCIKAGADGIIGGHQHRIQPLITRNRKPVFLGLGNFLFPPRYLRAPRPMYYPADDEDTSNYPITDGYPWVTEPTYKVWKKLGRIGAMAVVRIDDAGQSAEMKTIVIDDRHSVVFPTKCPLSKTESAEFNIVRLLLPDCRNLFVFKTGVFIHRVVNRINWILTKLRIR